MYLKNIDGEFRLVNTALDPEPAPTRAPRYELLDAYDDIKRLIGSNPDLKTLFEECLRDDGFKPAKRLTAPMPKEPELIEVSIWDNWQGDKAVKGQPQRYGVSVKAWTHKDVDFRKQDQVTWSGRVSLMTPKALRKAADRARQTAVSSKGLVKGNTNPISAEFAAMIEGACHIMESEVLAGGMLVTKMHGEGTLRHDRQMMFVDTAAILAGDMAARAVVFVDEDTAIQLPNWSTCDAAGKPLPESYDNSTGKHSICVAQIRYARDPDRFIGWITGRV